MRQSIRRPTTASPPLAALCLLALLAPPAAAREIAGHRIVRAEADRTSPAGGLAPGEASRGLRPLASFGAAVAEAAARLEALFDHNALQRGPVQNGFVRGSLAARGARRTAFSFHGNSPAREEGDWRLRCGTGGTVWSARVRIEDAYALRLRLDDVSLPPAAQIWVIADGGERAEQPLVLGPYGRELLDTRGGMWLPAAPGPEVAVEVHLPRSADRRSQAAFVFGEVAELFDLGSLEACAAAKRRAIDLTGSTAAATWDSCRIDATCIEATELGAIDNLREAVADITFVEEGTTYGCSATLLADEQHSGTPYLLTANHCFSTADAAASLTAYFDFRTATCNGVAPSRHELPQVAGSILLVTAAENDSTLVRLSGLPAGEVHFMGWTSERPESGEVMHSVTHPAGYPQTYASSSYVAEGAPQQCGNAYRRERYHLSIRLAGSTYYGSSGGAQVVDRLGGQVVGDIRGACFLDPEGPDWCDSSTYVNVTGSFEYTHPLVEAWLGASSGTGIFSDGFESGTTGAWSVP